MPTTTRVSSTLTAWHNLLRMSSRVVGELDRRLDLEHRISVKEFDVLINLDNAPGEALRMTGLAEAVMLSSGGLTRLVGRLEERGFVRREPDPADGRGFLCSLTPAGRERLAAARVTHDAVIVELLGGPLTVDELGTLAGLLGRGLADGPTRASGCAPG